MTKFPIKIDVLDHGYVRLWRVDGSDLDIENAARTSFKKKVDKLTPGFIERLATERHMSPFRHVGLWFEFKFPGDVRGQFLKHIVANCVVDEGTAWNEESFRGEKPEFEFHIPFARKRTKNWGQGDLLDDGPHNDYRLDLIDLCHHAEELYGKWIEKGIAPENARKFLPFYSLYTTVRSKMSLECAFHFWELRQSNHAQLEIREYAEAMDKLCAKYFPTSWKALKKAWNGGVMP